MSRFLRLFHLVLCAILACAFSSAFAADPVPSVTYYGTGAYGNFTTPTLYCYNYAERSTAGNPGWTYTYWSAAQSSPYTCTVRASQNSNPNNYSFATANPPVRKACADSTYVLSADQSICTPPGVSCVAGPAYTMSVKFPRDSLFPKIDGGCKVVVDEVVSCMHPTTGVDAYKVNYCVFKVRKTGETASGSPAPTEPVPAPVPTGPTAPANLPPTKSSDGPGGGCPAGSVAAGLDSTGITICMGSGTQPPGVADTKVADGPPVTVSNADGSQTTTVMSTTKNADGSTTTIKTNTTIGTDGTKTIEKSGTTSQTPAGANGRPDVEADKYDLCKQNPMLAICRNSSVTGTCGAIACDGDAIQCATLRATAQMECRQKQDADDLAASPMKVAGASILAGNDPMQAQIQGALSGTSVDLSNPNLDTSGFLGGGSCLAPFNFQFFGKSIPVSFATVCDNITPLRYGIMLAASILAYLIVARSVLGT